MFLYCLWRKKTRRKRSPIKVKSCEPFCFVCCYELTLKMAMSCFLRKISPVLRGSVLGSLSNKLTLPSCSVCFVRQPYHQQLVQGQNTGREYSVPLRSSWKSASLLSNAKEFSTSSALFASHKGHDHSKLWTFEKILSVTLLPLVPAALWSPSQQLDTALALVVVLHTHFGFEAIVVDYIRPILFGNVVPKIGLALVYVFSIVSLAGLLNLIYNDTGLANTIIQVWKK